MLASVLNSPIAVEASIHVVRAFVRLRRLVASNEEFSRRLKQLERESQRNAVDIQSLLEAIRELMTPPETPRKRIGFHPSEE